MPLKLSRRRFLAITASAAVAPGAARAGTAAWRGSALGAAAVITLGGTGAAPAEETFTAVTSELDRLEDVFSLHRSDSALSRLNREGRLTSPPADLITLLALCDTLYDATGGAFDPSVQPLWLALARGTRAPEAARDEVGWRAVGFDARQVVLTRSGMALTLNGVAQGFIADRIAALLAERGYRDVLIDMGEIAARGTKHGSDWRTEIAAPDGRILRRLALRDRALAVSAALGSTIDRAGLVGHIVDPRTGLAAPARRFAAVSADTAAVADGLSTGCCLLTAPEAARAVAAFGGARIESLI